MDTPIITLKESSRILKAGEGAMDVSVDLGITSGKILIEEGFAHLNSQKIPLSEFKKIKEKACYIIEENKIKKVAVFSGKTNLHYKLLPTKDWPTITLSSTPMHRFTFVSPKEDTQSKIREISPAKGRVLDTCCGLGYTSIMASKSADEVYTFEKDDNVLLLASFNPYSKELFNSKKIKIFEKNVAEEIGNFRNEFFERIMHDPPTFKYAPELYSKSFHAELYRVLRKGGILYHYCPSPHITKGRMLYPRIVRQLKECGFEKAEYHEKSSGIRAVKL